MTFVWLAAAISIVSSGFVAVFVVPAVAREVMLGMAAPLVVATGSFVMMDRTFRRDPGRLTRLLVRGFVVKMVVFGLYIVVGVSTFGLEPVAFVVSFTVYFVALHLAEAARLQRLLSGS